MNRFVLIFLSGVFGVAVCHATLVDDLLEIYDSVQTISCEVHREIEAPSGKVRMLSRVYYEKPDKIHVDNSTPLKRRYICDGEKMFYYIDGDPKGFSCPVAELNKEWLISLRKVPATPMDILLMLKEAPETDLESTERGNVRKGYQSENLFAVLSLDDYGRLVRVEFFKTREMKYRTAQYEYENFKQYGEKLWIPLLHKTILDMDGVKRTETTRISGIEVNRKIPEHLFVPAPFFKGVEFVDSFKKIYESR